MLFALSASAAPTSTIVQNLFITALKSSPTAGLTIDSNGLVATGTTGVTSTGGNWAGTWQLFSPSDFLSSSTPSGVLSVASNSSISFSAATGSNITATFLNPSGFITTSTFNATGTAFYFPYWNSAGNALSATSTLFIASSTGNIIIGTTTDIFSTIAGRNYLGIHGSTEAGGIELTSGAADGNTANIGIIQFTDVNSTATNKRVAAITTVLDGTTANNRGSDIVFYTKANNGSAMTEAGRFNAENGLRLSKGVAVFSNNPNPNFSFYGNRDINDPSTGVRGLSQILNPTYTVSSSVETYGLYTVIEPILNTNVVHSAGLWGNYVELLRNENGGSADDSGTLTTLVGSRISYGHYNTNASATPKTTNAYGLQIYPYIRTGTITNMYDLYLNSMSSGGTATNHWGVYQASTGTNYFAGTTGIGTYNPATTLDVNGDITDRNLISSNLLGTDSTGKLILNSTGYLTTSTNLGTANFATTSISQWNNNSGFITTSTNNFGGLTGNGTATYIPYYNGATTFLNSSALAFTSSTGEFVAPTGTFSGHILIATTTNPANSLFTIAASSNILTVLKSGNVGIGTVTPSSTLHVAGTFQLSASSTITTPSIGGSALLAGACTSATSSIDSSYTSSTLSTSEPTPQNYEGDGFITGAYLSKPGVLTVKVCAEVAGTPTATSYVVKLFR